MRLGVAQELLRIVLKEGGDCVVLISKPRKICELSRERPGLRLETRRRKQFDGRESIGVDETTRNQGSRSFARNAQRRGKSSFGSIGKRQFRIVEQCHVSSDGKPKSEAA